MKILITGSTGKVGKLLAERLSFFGHTLVLSRRWDLMTPAAIDILFDNARMPDLVINCAAMNGMEACAADPMEAAWANGLMPGHLASRAPRMIHFSTDYVFDGDIYDSPRSETDPPNPKSVYAKSKLLGEQTVAQERKPHLIFRVSTLYGRDLDGPLHPLGQREKGGGTPEVPLKVLHQFCTPTSARLIAYEVANLVEMFSKAPHEMSRLSGIWNLCTTGIWRREFIEYALKRIYRQTFAIEEFQLSMARPVYSALSNKKYVDEFGLLPTVFEDFELSRDKLIFPHKENKNVKRSRQMV